MRIILCLFGSLFLAFPSTIFATCGALSCALPAGTTPTGKSYMRLDYEVVDQNWVYVGDSPTSVGAISAHHDEVYTYNRKLNLQASIPLASTWDLRLDVPYIVRDHEHIHHHHGEELHENWHLSGLGDASLTVQHLFYETDCKDQFSVEVGLKLPTGATGQKNADGDVAEVAVQPGSGSFDSIIGLSYRGLFRAGIRYTMPGAGTDGWQFGNSLIANIGADYCYTKAVTLHADLIGKYQGRANAGTTGEPSENTGGAWLYFSPGLSYHLTRDVQLHGLAQVPVYQYLNGIQLSSVANARIGIEFSL